MKYLDSVIPIVMVELFQKLYGVGTNRLAGFVQEHYLTQEAHYSHELNKLIKFMCTDDIGLVLDGNCFDEVVAVEDVQLKL